MSAERICQNLVNEFRSRPTLRAGSLITTVFGDAIAPRGGTVWLGSLIKVMATFGVGERLVRTSVFRLAKDGWLQSDPIGRRSYYRLTDEGRERFGQATQRIYGAPTSQWDGEWCLLLLAALDTASKETVRRECGWLGFRPDVGQRAGASDAGPGGTGCSHSSLGRRRPAGRDARNNNEERDRHARVDAQLLEP